MAANTKKDNGTISILMVVAGILLALLSYLYVFNPCMEKKKTYNDEVKELNSTISDRENKVSNKEAYQEDTKNFETSRKKVLDYFPADIEAEDDLLFCKEIEDKLAFYYTQSGTFNSPIIFYADNVSSLIGYTRVCDYDFAISYESLSEMVDYINYYKYRRAITDLNVSYDNGALSGAMRVNEYYVVGGGNKYESPTHILDLNRLEDEFRVETNENPFNTLVGLNREDYDVIFK